MNSLKYIFAESRSFNPYFNLALEKYLYDNMHDDEIIFFLWQNEKTVVCGRNQNIYKECNVTKIEQLGGKIARRHSGGGAVFHDKGNLNFTFIANKKVYNLEKQLNVIIEACKKFGINAVPSGRNDIEVDGKKFSGNAFIKSKDRICHHGTIMIDINNWFLENSLNPSHEKLETKAVSSVTSRIANLKEFSDEITVEKMRTALVESFKKIYGFKEWSEFMSLGGQKFLSSTSRGGWPASSSTLSMLKEISESQKMFASNEWIFGEKFSFTNAISKRFDWGEIELNFEVKGDKIVKTKVYSDCLFPSFILEIEKGFLKSKYTAASFCSIVNTAAKNYDTDLSIITDDINNLITESI
ncbi:MAG: lipoate--protein ligase [Ruminococcaceae bacterium]|nr:lipoate--protein ligase [Oscillospiraceae bacterium]